MFNSKMQVVNRTLTSCTSYLVLLLFVTNATLGADQLQWNSTNLPPLPDAIGFGGPLVGVHGDALIVAGGANFPEAPPWEVDGKPKGKKVWHDRIFVLLPRENENDKLEWKIVGKLPYPLAYAPVISAESGMYILGGETFGTTNTGETKNHPTSEILRLYWNAAEKHIEIERDALPPLPRPSQYHNAGLIGTTIYVTASHAKDESSSQLDTKSFWSLDLSLSEKQQHWKELTPWPGKPREKMSVAVQNCGSDDKYDSTLCLYMFSGANWYRNENGTHDLTKFQHFVDCYMYHPLKSEWKRIADLPWVNESRTINYRDYQFQENEHRWVHTSEKNATADEKGKSALRDPLTLNQRPAVAAVAIDVGQSHILLFSGSTGRYITMETPHIPNFPDEVLTYHTITNTWRIAGKMPLGVVTTGITKWQGEIVIPSGETRPGVRTNAVQSLKITKSKSEFGMVNLMVLGCYLALLVWMGFLFSKRERGTEDFFLAGRRIPWWAAGISIYATQLSAITFLSLPAIPYAQNWLVYPGQLMIFAFIPVVIFFYLPFYRKLNITTAYEYLEKRFNVVARLIGSLSFILFQFVRMAIVVYLPALALSEVTGMNVYLCIVLMGGLSTLYTTLGGMEAVIWTDVLQVIVLWGGMLLSVVIVISDTGGIGNLFQSANADQKFTMFNWSSDLNQMATWIILLGNFALQFGPYTTDQAVVQRYLTTKDEAEARKSLWLSGILTIPFSLAFFILGTALYTFFKSHPTLLSIGMKNDSVFPLFIASQLPVGLSGLVVAGVFAASMSSLDSSIHSVATAITNDFFRRFSSSLSDVKALKIARVLTILIGGTGTLLAIILAGYPIKSLLFFFQKVLGLISSGLVGMFILGIFTRRANSIGAITGAISSFCLLYYVVFYTNMNFYIYAIIGISTAVIVGYCVSWITPSENKSLTGLSWATKE